MLITGSVVAIGEARSLLVTAEEPELRPDTGLDPDSDWDDDYSENGDEPDRELWR